MLYRKNLPLTDAMKLLSASANGPLLSPAPSLQRRCSYCCQRRQLLAAVGASLILKESPTLASIQKDPVSIMEKIHPPRPDWYEELYAKAMAEGMRSYETEIADFKKQLFAHLMGKDKHILELGVGVGPNFKYYAVSSDVHILGVDPNKQMEKYACEAALAAGLPSSNFSFMQGVSEALPIADNSLDAVVGTLVLCSVKDVDEALKEVKRVLKPGGLYLFIEHVGAKDGSLLRFAQTVLNPVQQFVADGCHLTRDTGKSISEAGFSNATINTASISTVALFSPHIYGFASK